MAFVIPGIQFATRGRKAANVIQKSIRDLFLLVPSDVDGDGNYNPGPESYIFFPTPESIPRDHTAGIWKKWAADLSARATKAKNKAKSMGYTYSASRLASVGRDKHGVFLVCTDNTVQLPQEEPEEQDIE